jgi:hypothetical protein
MNDYPKVVDEMVDEAFAKSNPTTLSAKYFAAKIKILIYLLKALKMQHNKNSRIQHSRPY